LSKVSEELLADSRMDVVRQVLLPDAVQAFAAAENVAFSVGTGSSQPQGIVAGGTVGVTTASPTAITADEVISLYYALSHLYRSRAVWLMNDATIEAVRTLKDTTDQYLWQPGMQTGEPDRLFGRPVFPLNAMDTIAASKKVMVFGDISFFWVVDFGGFGMQRLDELYAASGQVGFRWFRRIDSRVMLSEAIQVMQMHA
jgi:HK97 family phage major capsid protein